MASNLRSDTVDILNYNISLNITDFTTNIIRIKEGEKLKFLKLIRSGDNIEWVHIYKKSFVTFVNISFKDGTYLEVDLIHRFDRKGIIYLDAKDILNHVIVTKENAKISFDDSYVSS